MSASKYSFARVFVCIIAIVFAFLMPIPFIWSAILALLLACIGLIYLQVVARERKMHREIWEKLNKQGILLNTHKHWLLATPAVAVAFLAVLCITMGILHNNVNVPSRLSISPGLHSPSTIAVKTRQHHHGHRKQQKKHISVKPIIFGLGNHSHYSLPIGLILVSIGVVLLPVALWLWLWWWYGRTIITNDSLVLLRLPSPWLLLGRINHPWPGKTIQNVRVDSPRFFGQIFGYGTVLCTTKTNQKEDAEIEELKYIPNEQSFAEVLGTITATEEEF